MQMRREPALISTHMNDGENITSSAVDFEGSPTLATALAAGREDSVNGPPPDYDIEAEVKHDDENSQAELRAPDEQSPAHPVSSIPNITPDRTSVDAVVPLTLRATDAGISFSQDNIPHILPPAYRDVFSD